jgi:TRAP-type C4-dicarboxylate transport system permease small subunit
MTSGPDPAGGARPRAARDRDHAAPLDLSAVAGGARLQRLTRILALIGGGMLLFSVALSLVSIIGRYAFSAPVPGDYELVELTCAVAVFLFFPYTHSIGGNLTAEFFTSGLPVRWQTVLDVVHDAIFALLAALLAWRLGSGMIDKIDNGDSSILLQIPLWWPYTVAVACMWLLCAVSLWRVAACIGVLRR